MQRNADTARIEQSGAGEAVWLVIWNGIGYDGTRRRGEEEKRDSKQALVLLEQSSYRVGTGLDWTCTCLKSPSVPPALQCSLPFPLSSLSLSLSRPPCESGRVSTTTSPLQDHSAGARVICVSAPLTDLEISISSIPCDGHNLQALNKAAYLTSPSATGQPGWAWGRGRGSGTDRSLIELPPEIFSQRNRHHPGLFQFNSFLSHQTSSKTFLSAEPSHLRVN